MLRVKNVISAFCCLCALSEPLNPASSATEPLYVVNDVTQINPIQVGKILAPDTIGEIIDAVKTHHGPISIGGGRFSMGGQIASDNGLHLDMRHFNKILHFDPTARTITVQAGVRWRDIQDVIDPYDLSIRIMQTYSNFTVGGSLSVNVHGRYIGEGPIILSVLSIKVILADGQELSASPAINSEVFYATIGGYGGIGVITEATLQLVPNTKLRRETQVIPVENYKQFFIDKIRDDQNVVLHNGDLYPPDYKRVRLESWRKTSLPATVYDRLRPRVGTYYLLPNVISAISTFPYGAEIRAKFLDPLRDAQEAVVWRNYEASYDVSQLEPMTPRILFTYVLQEYFVPVDRFDEFVSRMTRVITKNNVNVVNVSIRHSMPDSGSFLAWAPEEVFSFVIYYKQGTSEQAKTHVAQWTRQLIQEALDVGGRYYLPYQIHASKEQFKSAYPGLSKFFAVKKRVDPTYKFRNKLWDTYYP